MTFAIGKVNTPNVQLCALPFFFFFSPFLFDSQLSAYAPPQLNIARSPVFFRPIDIGLRYENIF